mmetsp:Transcript_28039/g.41410  ORF Transcript_28039/g.41410 Transcript_28039/m.41410 type:complete len:230 (+) Transcript_28039:34-723(+)
MHKPILLLLLCFAITATSIPLIATTSKPPCRHLKTYWQLNSRGGSSQSKIVPVSRQSQFHKVVQKIFDDADTNHDGKINQSEFYELVLKLYLKINRKAPINPPSRESATQLFRYYDKDKSNTITRDEFVALATRLGQRAFIRIATFQVFKMLVSPLLAEYLVRKLAGKAWLNRLAAAIVPDRFEGKVIPIISSATFGRTILIILFMSTLGKTALVTVNMILDMSVGKSK